MFKNSNSKVVSQMIVNADIITKRFECDCIKKALEDTYYWPFLKDGKLGILNINGKIILEASYDYYPREDGSRVYEDYLKVIEGKYLRLRKNGKYGLIDLESFENILEFKYDYINDYMLVPGIIIFAIFKGDPSNEEYLYGFYNISAKRYIEPLYDDIHVNRNGTISACIGNYWGLINYYGKTIIPFTYLNEFKFDSCPFAIVVEGPPSQTRYKGFYSSDPKYSIITDKNVKLVDNADRICISAISSDFAQFLVWRDGTASITLLMLKKDHITKLENAKFYSCIVGNDRGFQIINEFYNGSGIWSSVDLDGNLIETCEKDIKEAKKRKTFFNPKKDYIPLRKF